MKDNSANLCVKPLRTSALKKFSLLTEPYWEQLRAGDSAMPAFMFTTPKEKESTKADSLLMTVAS